MPRFQLSSTVPALSLLLVTLLAGCPEPAPADAGDEPDVVVTDAGDEPDAPPADGGDEPDVPPADGGDEPDVPPADGGGEPDVPTDGGGEPDTPVDGGEPDTPADGGEPDAPADGGEPDTPADGGEPDVPADGGDPRADGGVDPGPDTPADGGVDPGPDADGGVDPGPDGGSVVDAGPTDLGRGAACVVDDDRCADGLACFSPGDTPAGSCHAVCGTIAADGQSVTSQDPSVCIGPEQCRAVLNATYDAIEDVVCMVDGQARDDSCSYATDGQTCNANAVAPQAPDQVVCERLGGRRSCQLSCTADAECPTDEECRETGAYNLQTDAQGQYVPCTDDSVCTDTHTCTDLQSNGTPIRLCATARGVCVDPIDPIDRQTLNDVFNGEQVPPGTYCERTGHNTCGQFFDDDSGGLNNCTRFSDDDELGVCLAICGLYDEGVYDENLCPLGYFCNRDFGRVLGYGETVKDAVGDDKRCNPAACTDGQPCPDECFGQDAVCTAFGNENLCLLPYGLCEAGPDPVRPNEGEVCDLPDECAGGLTCLPNPSSPGTGLCTRTCGDIAPNGLSVEERDPSPCEGDDICQAVIDLDAGVIGAAVCLPPVQIRDGACRATLGDVNCDGAAIGGPLADQVVCQRNGVDERVCQITCNDGGACPDSETCMSNGRLRVQTDVNTGGLIDCVDDNACDAPYTCRDVTYADGSSGRICADNEHICANAIDPISQARLQEIFEGDTPVDGDLCDIGGHDLCAPFFDEGSEGSNVCVDFSGGAGVGACIAVCGFYDDALTYTEAACPTGFSCTTDMGRYAGLGRVLDDGTRTCVPANCTEGQPCPDECGDPRAFCETYDSGSFCLLPTATCEADPAP